MAEFSEVMKQIARMADACDGECEKCPLDYSLCTSPWCYGNTEGIAEAERIVMSWAAEHPEPVYPTWGEWLQQFGLVTDVVNGRCGNFMYNLAALPIPADIAEKLGLEPKEG